MPRPRSLPLLALALVLPAGAQTIVWRGNNALWSTGTEWGSNAVPGATDTAQVSGGVASVNSAATVGRLLLSGGTIGGSATLVLSSTAAASEWSAGSLTGTGTLQIATGASLELTGSAHKVYSRADGNGFGGRIIENFGTFKLGGTGNLLGGDGAQFLNQLGGTFLLHGDLGVGHSGSGNAAIFTNAGTFRKSSGTGTATVSGTVFTTSGRVEALAGTGTLAFTSGVTSNGGTFDAATGSRIALSGGQTFNTGTAFTGAGTVTLDGGTTTVDGALSSQNLVFAGGDLRGSATVSGALSWTGGDWVSTGTLKIASGGTLSISGSANKRFIRNDGNGFGGRIIENLGDIVWTGTGQLLGGDGAQIINQATGKFLIQTAGTLAHSGSGNLPTFTNSGIVRQTVTTGATTIAVPFVNQAGGSVDVQSGSLTFTGSVTSNGGSFVSATGTSLKFTGGQNFGNGTVFTATGPISITSGDTTLSGAIVAGGLEFGGGSLYGSASVTGAMSWTGGLWRGADTLTIASGGTLTMSGAAVKTLSRADGNGFGGRIVQIGGTLKWVDTGALAGNDAAGISVSSGGLFEIRNDSTYAHGGSGNLAILSNAGTVRKLASTGTTTLTGIEFSNTGTLELASGTIQLTGGGGLANSGIVTLASGTTLLSSASDATSSGGTFNLAAGSLLKFTAGTNTFDGVSLSGGGVTTVDGGTLIVSATDLSAKLSLLSGTIGGSGTLSVGTGGSFVWSGGSMTGTGTLFIGTGGLMSIDGTTVKNFFRNDGNGFGGRAISNFGTVTWSGTGAILGGDGAQITNQAGALFEITGDAKFAHYGAGNAATFVNSGAIRKSAGTGITEFAQSLTNTGTIESKSGTILLSGGGSGSGQFKANGGELIFSNSYTLNNGARFFGLNFVRATSGTLTVPAGEQAAVGSASLGGFFSLENSLLGGAGTFLVDALGRMEWTTGALRDTGTLQIASGGELRILGSGDHSFYRGDGNGFGGRTIDNYGTVAWSGGTLLAGDGAQIINRTGALFSINGGTTLGHTGSGNGLLFTNAGTFRKSGTELLSVSSGSFINSGVVEVVAGNLNFNLGVTSNAGKFDTTSGATLTFAGGQSFNDGTKFLGFGTAQVAAGDTYLNGTITADYFRISGGRVFGNATLDGYFEWAGGSLMGAGTFTLTAASLFDIAGSGHRDFFRGDGNGFGGRIIDNSGFILVQNDGDLRGGDGAQFINRASGLVSLYNDRAITHTGSGNTLTVTNYGQFTKFDGSGTSTVAVPFHNDGGTIGVYSDGTLAFTSTFTNTNGNVVLASGGRLTVPGILDLGTGTLTASGTITAPGGVKSNGSLVIDQLTIIGDLTLLGSSSLHFMLGTSIIAAESDGPGGFMSFAIAASPLSVTGQVTLGGSLHVFIHSGTTLLPTDTFTLLNTSALLSGSFTNVASGQRLVIPGTGSFLVNYGGTSFASSIVLSDFQAIPEPSTYMMLALGAGLILFLQRRRTRR